MKRPARFHLQGKEKVPPEGLPYVRGGETLEVMLRDDVYGLELSLFYTVFDDQDAVVRSAKLVNRSGGDLRVQKISSFSLVFPDASYDTVCLYGRPCRERMPVREACGPGIREFSSALRGSSSHYLNPFFALVRRETDEHAGDAYGIALVYSGAFSLSAEMTSYGTLRVQGGISDCDFSWLLKDGQSFRTPEAALVFSCGGLGGMSRAFHALWREKLLPSRFSGKPGPLSSTAGKPRTLISMHKNSSRSSMRRQRRARIHSFWTTAGSSSATMTAAGSVTGLRTGPNSPAGWKKFRRTAANGGLR